MLAARACVSSKGGAAGGIEHWAVTSLAGGNVMRLDRPAARQACRCRAIRSRLRSLCEGSAQAGLGRIRSTHCGLNFGFRDGAWFALRPMAATVFCVWLILGWPVTGSLSVEWKPNAERFIVAVPRCQRCHGAETNENRIGPDLASAGFWDIRDPPRDSLNGVGGLCGPHELKPTATRPRETSSSRRWSIILCALVGFLWLGDDEDD